MRRWSCSILVALVLSTQLCAQTTKPRKPKLPPAPAGVVIRQDVAYLEPGREEKLDLYLPEQREKDVRSPAVVLIHGGGWVGGDKAAGREFEIGTTLAKAGYVCASINYTLERGNWPQNLYDCKNAVRFLRKNSDSYQIDVKHIGVIGGSAGGHLALMVAYTTDVPELEPKAPYPEVSDAVNCVVDMYGITNLLTRSKTDDKGNAIGTPGDKAAAMLKEPRVGHEALWKSASPVTYVTKKTPPTLILHGLADTTVNHDQATELAAKLKELGVEHEIHMIPGIGHTFDFETWNRKPLPQDLRPIALAFFDKHLKEPAKAKAAASIKWDVKTLRYLCPGGYPRMIRLSDGATLLSCEDAGRAVVRRSEDDGKTWSEPIVAAQSSDYTCANPQPTLLKSGAIALFYNGRPHNEEQPYTIELTISRDGGKNWTPRSRPIYRAGITKLSGCYEPAAVQLASGEILLFFANESPYAKTGEQEITLMRSSDECETWSAPSCFSLRRGGRDGMPVPLVLKSGQLVVAIEDTGRYQSHKLQPTILRLDSDNKTPISSDDERRWEAISSLDHEAYAGAPFIAQFSTGETVLSFQFIPERSTEWEEMIVCIGDEQANSFVEMSRPFSFYASPIVQQRWNSLFVRNDDTIVALTGAKEHFQRAGVFAIDGKLVHKSGDTSR